MMERTSLRLAGTLLLAGQLLYIVITLFHADGPANNHPVVFAEYAASGTWTVVHVAQFACTAIFAQRIARPFLRRGRPGWQSEMGESLWRCFDRSDVGVVRQGHGSRRSCPQTGRQRVDERLRGR